MRRLSLAEELTLGCPLPLDGDETVCDRVGCLESGCVIIPGAYLCDDCLAAVMTEDGRYRIWFSELAWDREMRDQRRVEYEDRLEALRAEDGGARRTVESVRLLAAIVGVIDDETVAP